MIKHWLASPEFPGDERKTQHARLLQVTLLSILTFLVLSQIGVWLGGRTPFADTVILITLVAACLIGYLGLYRGLVREVGFGLVAILFIGLTAGVASLGTIRAPITSAYYAVILIAGLLFDLPGIVVVAALSSFTIGGLILAQNAGLLPAPDASVTITQWFTYTTLFVTNGSLIFVVIRATRRALQRAETEIAERKRAEEELRKSEQRLLQLNSSLQTALAEVKTLSGLLPICANCKKIRDDKGYWNQIETYIAHHTDASFTHGICPDCMKHLYPFVKLDD